MSLPMGTYKFHEYSQNALSDFIRTSRQHGNEEDLCPPTDWGAIFKNTTPPIDAVEDLQADIIDLTMDDEIVPIQNATSFEIDKVTITNFKQPQISVTVQPLLDTIIEEGGYANKDILISIEVDQAEEIFIQLKNHGDHAILLKFGQSLLLNKCSDNLARLYVHLNLIPMAVSNLTHDVKKIFNDFVLYLKGIASILLKCVESHSAVLLELTSSLSESSKVILFEDYVSNSAKLEIEHIVLLDNLLSKSASRENVKKLIQLLTAVADLYVKDKVYGRYLFRLTETLGPDVKHFEEEINTLIKHHKSIWRKKAENLFTTFIESDPGNVTQSFLF